MREMRLDVERDANRINATPMYTTWRTSGESWRLRMAERGVDGEGEEGGQDWDGMGDELM